MHEQHFDLKELLTNYICSDLSIQQTFIEINEVSVSCQGKQLTIFVVNNKMWVSRWNLNFEKLKFHYHALDGFQRLEHLSVEFGGDIKECDFVVLYN